MVLLFDFKIPLLRIIPAPMNINKTPQRIRIILHFWQKHAQNTISSFSFFFSHKRKKEMKISEEKEEFLVWSLGTRSFHFLFSRRLFSTALGNKVTFS